MRDETVKLRVDGPRGNFAGLRSSDRRRVESRVEGHRFEADDLSAVSHLDVVDITAKDRAIGFTEEFDRLFHGSALLCDFTSTAKFTTFF